MGYYHVEDTGKGVYIKEFDSINNDYEMPPMDYIQKYLKYQDNGYTENKKNLDWISEMDTYHKIAFLSMSNYEFSSLDVHTPKEFCREYDNDY